MTKNVTRTGSEIVKGIGSTVTAPLLGPGTDLGDSTETTGTDMTGTGIGIENGIANGTESGRENENATEKGRGTRKERGTGKERGNVIEKETGGR